MVLNISLAAGGASVASYGATPPRRMVMRHGGGRGAEAVFRGAEPGEAQIHEGASEPAVDTCCLWPVWNTGCLCGNEYCRLCRSKTIRPAQRCQHGSMTEPFVLKMLQVSGKAEARSAVHTLLAAALRDRMPNRDSARRGSATPPLPVQPQLTCGVRLRWRRETCGPEHRGRPADTFGNKTL